MHILCDHSNETSSAVLVPCAMCHLFFNILQNKILEVFCNFDFWHSWEFKIKTRTAFCNATKFVKKKMKA